MPACTRIPLRSLHPPLCLGMVLVLAAHAPAWAQAAAGTAPSQITPPTLRPPARGSAEAVVIAPAADTAAPPGSDTLFVAPGGFVVVSDSPLLLQLSHGVALPAPHTRLSVTELFALAAQLEQAYVRAGYPLVRVVLPAQSVVDGGSVRFTVVDGFIEAIDVEGLPVSVREPVRRRVQSLVGVRGLRLAELERRLLIAGDTPGLTLRSTLVAGEARGGTKLILDGRHAPITGSLSADNRLSPALQRWQFGPSAALNSVLGLGEQFYATLRTGSQLQDTFGADPLLRILAVGAALPLGGDGLSVAAELTDSQTHAIAAPGATDAVGTLRRITLRTAYPVLRTRTDALTVGLAFDRLEQSSEAPIFGVDLSRDRYTALRGTLDVTSLMPWGARVSSTFTLSGGLGGRDADAASQSGVPLSRQGAEPRFRKFGAALQYSQPLPLDRTRIDLFAAGQTAFGHAMLQSEQFSLEGAALVSGVPSGTLGVDSGAALRAEVQRSVLIDWSGVRTTLAPYVFAAYGRGRIAWPTSVETPRVIGRSHGAGLRTELGQAGIGSTHSLALEWARQASDAPGLKPGYRAAVFYAVSF